MITCILIKPVLPLGSLIGINMHFFPDPSDLEEVFSWITLHIFLKAKKSCLFVLLPKTVMTGQRPVELSGYFLVSSQEMLDLTMLETLKDNEKYGQPAAILLDEYEKPILDNIDQPKMAVFARETLKAFYSGIRDNDVSSVLPF